MTTSINFISVDRQLSCLCACSNFGVTKLGQVKTVMQGRIVCDDCVSLSGVGWELSHLRLSQDYCAVLLVATSSPQTLLLY